jgi:hypothetical protein
MSSRIGHSGVRWLGWCFVALQWWGIRDRHAVRPAVVEDFDAVADAARSGRWDRLFELIDDGARTAGLAAGMANAVRVGGLSGYAPLHQVAWHGAAVEVARELIGRGAWRTLRCSAGSTPRDIAEARGHEHLLPVLTSEPVHEVAAARLDQLEHILHAVIVGRVRDFGLDIRLRLPQLGPLTEVDSEMWMAVPGMYGGFEISLVGSGAETELSVASWCRIAGGSGQRHRVHANGFELVEHGFV